MPTNNESTANRGYWEFTYKASALREAALKKQQHHEGRAQWWVEQKDAVMQQIREGGVEISESMELLYALSSGSAKTPTVTVREDLQRQLSECHQKIKEHQGKAKTYVAWIQMLADHPDAELQLKHEDWVFFFSA